MSHLFKTSCAPWGAGVATLARAGPAPPPPAVEAARAARNIERVSLQEAAKLNTLDLAQYQKIIVSTKALEAIIARVNGGKN